MKCAKGSYVEFYKSGKLKIARLSQDQKIQGIEYKQWTMIFFDKKGKVVRSH